MVFFFLRRKKVNEKTSYPYRRGRTGGRWTPPVYTGKKEKQGKKKAQRSIYWLGTLRGSRGKKPDILIGEKVYVPR